MTDLSKNVKVNIFGEEYSIRGLDDSDYILRVADLVDKKMREIASKSRNKAPHRIAVLTALNLAGELLDLKENSDREMIEVEGRAKDILELLDSKLIDSA